MRAVVERVAEATVRVGDAAHASIGPGLLVYLGVERDDDQSDVAYMTDKVRHLRIFPDEDGRMNLDVAQADGAVLVVSAFTVQADARRGRRPSFESAARPEQALLIYEMFCDSLARAHLPVERGSFGDEMYVQSIGDGPVCILLESRRLF